MYMVVLSRAQTQFKIILFRELLHPSTGQGILRVNHVGILDLVVRFSCFTVVCLPLPLASSAYWCSLLSEAFLRSHFHPITERVAHITFSLARDKHLEGFSPKLQEGSFSCQVNNYLLVMIFLLICCGIFREFKKSVEDESQTEQITLYSYSILNDFILGITSIIFLRIFFFLALFVS